MLSIEIDEDAIEDIAQAMTHYELQREELGEAFLGELKSFLQQVARMPRLYPLVRGKFHRGLMSRFPDVVYYQIGDHAIEVFAVMHGSRSRQYVSRRLKPRDE